MTRQDIVSKLIAQLTLYVCVHDNPGQCCL